MTTLAVFRSRAQSLDFSRAMKRAGVPVQTVSTPKEAGVGCGISVKFDDRFRTRAAAVLSANHYSSFSGFLHAVGGNYFYDG